MAVPPPPSPTSGRQAAADLQALLRRLGIGGRLHITTWGNLGEGGYVYVPPLPAEVVQRLVDLAASEAASRVKGHVTPAAPIPPRLAGGAA